MFQSMLTGWEREDLLFMCHAERSMVMVKKKLKGYEVLRASGHYSSEAQSKRRKNQIAAEVSQADDLKAEGYEVYSPTVVCDRIAVKDGKVFFVEFKKHRKQKLRSGQQRIHDLVPKMYKIRYQM